MVDLRRVAGTLGRLLLRGTEAALALLVLFSVVLIGELAAMPEQPNDEGTIGLAILAGWFFSSTALVLLAGGHALVVAIRRAFDDGPRGLVDLLPVPLGSALAGLALFYLVPVVDVQHLGFLWVVAISFALAVAVLLTGIVDVVRFLGSAVGSD